MDFTHWLDKHFKAPGAYVPLEYREEYAKFLLTARYNANQKFMDGLSALHSKFRSEIHQLSQMKVANSPIRVGIYLSPAPSTSNNPGIDSCHPEFDGLFTEAETFTKKWGLSASWATQVAVLNLVWGHQCEGDLDEEAWQPRFFSIVAMVSEQLHEEITPPRWDPKLDTEAEFDQRVGAYKQSIKDRSEALGMKRTGGKSSLETHVQWLYWHICPDPDKGRPLRFSEIVDSLPLPLSDEDNRGEDTVGKAVRALARTLGLASPV